MKGTIKEYQLKALKTDFPKKKIIDSRGSAEFIREFYGDDIEIYESVFILMLNRANNTVGYAKISQGGTAGTVVDIKIIAKYALDSLAHGIILAHNHPSGELSPSTQDKEITNKIKQALKLFDCTVLDHVILTKESYYSFADEGIL
jgi:DNA repair protein RadC